METHAMIIKVEHLGNTDTVVRVHSQYLAESDSMGLSALKLQNLRQSDRVMVELNVKDLRSECLGEGV